MSSNDRLFSNNYLKSLIAFGFLFLSIIFGLLAWEALNSDLGRTIGWVMLIFSLYFFAALFWMFRSMNHLYFATALPLVILGMIYLLYAI